MADYSVDIIPVFDNNYIFIFHCNISNSTACIDPADAKVVIDYLEGKQLTLDFILNTHHHRDHVGGNQELKDRYGCEIVGYVDDQARIPHITSKLFDGDVIDIGEHKFEVIFVPGHTSGHIAYFCLEQNILFIGDTIFSSGCGRLFEGSAEQMYNSLEKIKRLPEETKIFCAHEYTLSNIEFALTLEPSNLDLHNKLKRCKSLRDRGLSTIPTTLGEELKTNPFLRTLSAELRKNAGKTTDSYNEEVFAAVRKLKDRF